ncbi:NAD-glutamate dehydrogenase [Micromonospora sp. AMSO31t]|nr:NAD-glutamate dehydrogenase [Micromonospora sp. AMSO31t]KAB1915097.1 NAD-glutamate dehydrogenase [Micromonospora sp. AMSO31t]
MTDDAPVTEQPDTRQLDELLDDIFHGQERISQADIYRRAVAAELPAELLTRIAALPQGEYAVDEAADLLGGTVA